MGPLPVTHTQPHTPKYLQMSPLYPHNLSAFNMLFTRLPRELQSEVFLRCLPPDGTPLLHSKEPPLVLLQVCRAWRNLALATPRLWSSFRIEFQDCYDASTRENDKLVSIVASWLIRSGDVPISVTLSYLPLSSVSRGKFNSAATAVVALLLQYSGRWDSMKFRIPGEALTPLLATGSHSFPNLRTFVLDLQGGWCAPEFSIGSLGVNWSELTELSLILENGNVLTLDECWDILSLASNLESCTLNAQCVFRRPCRPSELILPLESFHLILQGDATDSGASLICFLNSFDLPFLSELRLHWFVQEGALGSASETFCQFLERLQPSIELLQLAYLPISEQQLLELLQCVPFLKHLSLRFSLSQTEDGPITSDFFRALSKADHPLLPQLQSVHIDSSGIAWSPDALISALDSRLHSGLKFSAFISENAENVGDIFERWKSQGLDVNVRYLMLR